MGSTEVKSGVRRLSVQIHESTSQTPAPNTSVSGVSGGRWQPPVLVQAPARGQKRKRLEDQNQILGGVQREETREDTLVQRLTEHVERIDTDMVRDTDIDALRAMCAGMALCTAPRGTRRDA